MKTTELFIDQVLIGFLVVATFWALSPIALPELQGLDFSKAAVLVIAAYFTGILFDRFADTLLQDLERHTFLRYSLDTCKERGLPRPVGPKKQELLPIGMFRMAVIRDPNAREYSDYLRSRMRLTRALAVISPAMSIALVAFLVEDECERLWTCGVSGAGSTHPGGVLLAWWPCVAIAGIYALAFVSQLFKTAAKHFADAAAAALSGVCWVKPPKTFVSGNVLNNYLTLIGGAAPHRGRIYASLRRLVVVDPILCLSALVLLGVGVKVALTANRADLAVIPPLGLVVAFWAGWTWLRINKTFLSFIDNFASTVRKSGKPE